MGKDVEGTFHGRRIRPEGSLICMGGRADRLRKGKKKSTVVERAVNGCGVKRRRPSGWLGSVVISLDESLMADYIRIFILLFGIRIYLD